MWNPWKVAREERRLEREAFLAALVAMQDVVSRQLEIVRQQTHVVEGFIGFFAAQGPPESRTLRDEDEFKAEVEREKAAMRWFGEES